MKFSVVVPNYNNSKYLKRCLNSILGQTYKNFELIIVDDMSTDNSREILEEYSGTYPKIKLIELETKRLNGGARNEGILKPQEIILFV